MPVPAGPIARLRKCTGQEDGSILPRGAPLAHQEHNILAAFQAAFNFHQLFFAVHRLLIHFQNYVAAAHVNVFREGTRLYFLHHHTLALRQIEPVRDFRGDFTDGDAELVS